MFRWVYLQNNAYETVARIENGVAKFLTQTTEFPDITSMDDEKETAISTFMEKVIDVDNSPEWEELPEDELLNGNDILWEKKYISSSEAEQIMFMDDAHSFDGHADLDKEFEEFMHEREKEVSEWDYADLGEFFESLGYETIV